MVTGPGRAVPMVTLWAPGQWTEMPTQMSLPEAAVKPQTRTTQSGLWTCRPYEMCTLWTLSYVKILVNVVRHATQDDCTSFHLVVLLFY